MINEPVDLNRVVVASFATPRYSGGGAVLIGYVRLLREAGIEAWLWLSDERALPWADVGDCTIVGATLDLHADDLLVVPEVPVMPGHDPAPGARKVIVNQNHFYTFAAAPDGELPFAGWRPAPDIWTVSDESVSVLTALFPEVAVRLVRNRVDVSPEPRNDEPRRVSWLPKKRPREAALLHRLLRADVRLAGVELCPLVDVDHADVLATLARSTVFVALGHSEGFGLPTAEALAAGCLVCGYAGGGGTELFTAPGAWAVSEQRPLLLRERVVDLVTRADELAPLAAANARWIEERYSPERTRNDLLTAVHAAARIPSQAATAVHPAAWLDRLGPNFTAFA